jgi:hypothetical protein
MNTNLISNKLFLASLILALIAILPLRTAAVDPAAATLTQVIGGLHSPRGLAFGPGDRLFVAQSGDDTAGSSIIEVRDPDGANPQARTVVSGLPTTGGDGQFLGLHDVATSGSDGNFILYGVIGLAPQIAGRPFGSFFRANPSSGDRHTIINIGSLDFAWTGEHKNLVPDQFPDANPYRILILPHHTYVVDAAANTVDEVLSDGSVRILAFLPNTPLSDAVPTGIDRGPDGALYIGTLALVDTVLNGPDAKIYRLDPSQANLQKPWETPLTVFASGLFSTNGLAFGPDGNLYVSELFTNTSHDFGTVFSDPHGDVLKIPFAHPDRHISLTGGTLRAAGDVAIAPNGDIYVADGTSNVPPGTGRIVRIQRQQ